MMTGLTDEFSTEVFSTNEISKEHQEGASCGLRMLSKDEVVSQIKLIKELING
jgi:hypothetical protein